MVTKLTDCLFCSGSTLSLEFIKERFPEGSVGYNRAKPFIDNYFTEMSNMVMASKKTVNVICHGDCWTNNILFKYSEVKS